MPLLVVAIFSIALTILYGILRDYHYQQVLHYLRTLRLSVIFGAVALTALGYFVMTLYDVLAIEYVGRDVPYRRIALASFIGYAFNNSMGFSGVIGGSLRYRLYSAWRLSAVDIAKVIAFVSATFWLGFLTLAGAFFLAAPPVPPAAVHLHVHPRPLGVLFVIPVLVYLGLTLAGRRSFRLRQWRFPLPHAPLAIGQIVVSSVDWLIAAAVLYVLLPNDPDLSFPHFIAIFLLAQIAGLLSNLPGGIGVFELVILLFLSPAVPPDQVLGGLLAFRGIYYLVPLGSAVLLLATHEVLEKRQGVARVARLFGRWAPGVVPHVFAFTTFVAGAILIFSGSTPSIRSRLAWLNDFLPLPVMEISHMLGSVAGVLLLVLARGLQRRLDAAWVLTVALLGGGIVVSLLKGLDYEEAIFLAVMLVALVPSRGHFYRQASLFTQRFAPGWLAAIAVVLIGSMWLGFFSYKHVEYSNELWWRFSMHAEAPRFLRGTVAGIAVLFFIAGARLLRPVARRREPLPQPDSARLAEVIAGSKSTAANLALLGDKSFLFSESGESFIMFGVEGRSWISMGDPVGPDEEKADLVWRFRELSDRHGGWTVFYEVHREWLPLYVDLGLALLKLGEEAIVSLDTFTLDGGERKGLRKTIRKTEADGATFEIVAPESFPEIAGAVREVSDGWMKERHVREKGFSLGRFDENYLSGFPLALVRREGRIVAFSNLWTTATREELSIDLMRHTEDAPAGVMDFLFVNLMLWGKSEGYRRFNLGVAPLSGLENRALGPLWNRIGALAFHHGENFYNFQGLRQYKEKFDPVWSPVYLASPGGFVLPRVLTNIASLISGGLRGVVAK